MKPKTQTLVRRRGGRRNSKLTESEFVEWLRELADDPKWKKHPSPWDEHTFRVGVQMLLKRVAS